MTANFLSRIALLWGYGNCFLNWSSFFWRYYILCHMHYIYTRLVFCAGVILNSRQGLFSPLRCVCYADIWRTVLELCNNRDLRTPQCSRLHHLSTHSLSVINTISHLWWMPALFSLPLCFLNSDLNFEISVLVLP